jgi:hypothetical protein
MRKLTKNEWEIIEHRLGAWDLILDCFLSTESMTWTAEEIEAAAEGLLSRGPKGIDLDNLGDLELDILQDCCDGCSYFADIEDAAVLGEISKSKMYRMFKAAETLGEKLKCPVCTS